MKINSVIKAVRDKYTVLKLQAMPGFVPELAIYMDNRYWYECKSEIKGGVSCFVNEFYHKDEIMGFKVWRVPPIVITESGKDRSHSPFIVVDLSPRQNDTSRMATPENSVCKVLLKGESYRA